MCGRLVNLDTVARVLADYYHLRTGTQLAALNEALSRVPAETVGKELFGNSEQLEASHKNDHVADPGKMVGDLISRQVAEDIVRFECGEWAGLAETIVKRFETVPSAQPKLQPTCNQLATDFVSRQAALDAVNSLIDRFERILSDIRELNVDDSVCGMCEYDGAYMGQSGDWCNECPGFEKDNCFKLSDECRKRWFDSVELPSAQQERKKGKWIYNSPVTMKCNQCGFVIKDWDWHRFKYCPNCDADMREENDERPDQTAGGD